MTKVFGRLTGLRMWIVGESVFAVAFYVAFAQVMHPAMWAWSGPWPVLHFGCMVMLLLRAVVNAGCAVLYRGHRQNDLLYVSGVILSMASVCLCIISPVWMSVAVMFVVYSLPTLISYKGRHETGLREAAITTIPVGVLLATHAAYITYSLLS